MKKLLFFTLFIFLDILCSSQLYLDAKQDRYDDFKIQYIESDEPIDKIVKTQGWQEMENRFAFGYKFSTIWFKIIVENNQSLPMTIFLEHSEPFSEITDFYVQENGTVELFQGGLHVPMRDRGIKSQQPTLKLDLSPYQSKTVYIKYSSRFTSYGSFVFYSDEALWQKRMIYNSFFMFYFGAVLGMIIYNLLIYFSLRDRVYLYYVGYAFTFSFWVFLYSGYSLYFFDKEVHYFLHFTTPFSFVFFTLFTREMLGIDKSRNTEYTILKYFIVMLLFSSVFVGLNLEYGYLLTNVLGFIFFPVYALLAVFAMRRGLKVARFYLIAFLIYVFLMSLVSNLALGVFSFSILTKYSFVIGSFAEISLFSFLLAFRINSLRQEKIDAQSMLLELRENETAKLEESVALKTYDLNITNLQLTKMLKERELLVKEIYHRVKNNLQVITALLWFQSNKSDNQETKKALLESFGRIKSISLIHDLLYSFDDVTRVSSRDYFYGLIGALGKALGINSASIAVEVDDFYLDPDSAMSLGIIVAEVVSNSKKHAKKDMHDLKIDISLKNSDGSVLMSMGDNGIGFDANEIGDDGNLGLKIIYQTVQKLKDGSVEFVKNNGAQARVRFVI